MYTFEQVENILYKQAHKVKNLFPKYELNELVNEVWVKGNIHQLDNIKYVANRSHWDMMDYVRISEGRDLVRKNGNIKRPKYITNMHNIKRSFDKEHDHDFFDDIESKGQNNLKLIDDKDEINHLLKCLTEKKRIILKKYFLESMSLIEMGNILGLKGTTITFHKKHSIEKIREHHNIKVKKSEEIRILNTSKVPEPALGPSLEEILPEEILPEYVSDYEIDNKCALAEDFDIVRKTLLL